MLTNVETDSQIPTLSVLNLSLAWLQNKGGGLAGCLHAAWRSKKWAAWAMPDVQEPSTQIMQHKREAAQRYSSGFCSTSPRAGTLTERGSRVCGADLNLKDCSTCEICWLPAIVASFASQEFWNTASAQLPQDHMQCSVELQNREVSRDFCWLRRLKEFRYFQTFPSRCVLAHS